MNDSYPDVIKASLVGAYPAEAHAGGGNVWDDVLEYRVWCHPERGAVDREAGNDHYCAFATYAEAAAFAENTAGTEEPAALIRQVEYIDEPTPGEYHHMKELRIAGVAGRFSSSSSTDGEDNSRFPIAERR